MIRIASFALAAGLFAALLAGPARADDAAAAPTPDARLMIVNGNTGNVIYDDGYDDLYCVTRLHRWHDEYGYRHHYRSMRCR